jgi:hypothetical protein
MHAPPWDPYESQQSASLFWAQYDATFAYAFIYSTRRRDLGRLDSKGCLDGTEKSLRKMHMQTRGGIVLSPDAIDGHTFGNFGNAKTITVTTSYFQLLWLV